MNVKVTVFTGTRAEYGLLYWLMNDIQQDRSLELQLIVTGSHLSQEFGLTYKEIEKDGFHINEKVEIILPGDNAISTVKSLGLAIQRFADSLMRLKPDIIIILGDRYEALGMAQAAMILKIPIIHLHGGEISEGAYDDNFRHAITKFSYLHGTSTEEYRSRVIQLGEDPSRVFNVGAIGLEHLTRSNLFSFDELKKSINFNIKKPYFVLTYHPVTLGNEDSNITIKNILEALKYFKSHQIIATYPNVDNGGREIIKILKKHATKNKKNFFLIPSLGQKKYLSAVKFSDAVIGNSSSGIIEVPSFNIPTINIGIRQKGRIAAKSVLHCDVHIDEIIKSIDIAISKKFKKEIQKVKNPYGKGNTSSKVINMIKELKFNPMKTFYNIKSIEE